MEDAIVYQLSALGFGPFFEEQLSRSEHPASIPARIAAEHRGAYAVWSASGTGRAQLAGKLRTQLEDKGLPAVGDWVILKDVTGPDRITIIDHMLARRTVFSRGAAGREGRTQVVAANVDLVFAVCGLDADFNVRRIERYLARIWASGAQPAVILNKADICENTAARMAEVQNHCPMVPVHVTSALRSEGLDVIRASIRDGLTAAFVGSSGAGKSTLINAFLGEERMPTGEVRARDGRGFHVTTHRQLVMLTEGGLLLDTPGMRELQLVDEDGIDSVFEEIVDLSERCRFRDCRHDTEPGCAVKEAMESGDLSADRLEHYRKLVLEAQACERRHNERLRRQSERVWGQLYDEAARLRHWKGGPGR
jgi:ribosome biogenesis GTPase